MRARLPLLASLLVAFLLRVWGITFGLPHTLTRPDEEAVFSISLGVFQRYYDPKFFDWPSLYLYIVSFAHIVYFNLGRLIGWFDYEHDFLVAAARNATALYLDARLVSAGMGVLTVWAIYRVGEVLFSRRVGLIAAVFLAVAPLHVRDSHFGVPDVTATALIAVSFLFTARYWSARSRRDALLAALFAGLAASAKYNAGVVLLPAIVAVLAVASRGTTGVDKAARLRLAALLCLVAAAAFLAGTPYALLNWRGFIEGLRRISAHLAAGHAAFAGWAWGVHLRSSLWYGLGAPLFLGSVAGLVHMLWRGGAGRLTAIFPIVYFVMIGAGQTAFARYILPVIPWLCLSAAYAVSGVGELVSARWPQARPVAVSAFAALLAMPALWTSIQLDRLLARRDTRLMAAEWIAREYPQPITIYQSGASYGQVQWSGDSPAKERYASADFDEGAGVFRTADGRETVPRLVVLQQHPLTYSQAPARLAEVLDRGFVRRVEFTAVPSFAGVVFDMDDALYLPLSGLGRAERPGPNLVVYESKP